MNSGLSQSETDRRITLTEQDVEFIANLAFQLRGASEKEIYSQLALGLQKFVGEKAVISVSNFDSSQGRFTPQILSGLGPFMEKVTQLLGVRPEGMMVDFPADVKALLSTGRLTRLPGGVSQLAGKVIDPTLLRAIVSLLGLEEVYVQGYRQGEVTGGIVIITREHDLPVSVGVIEVMTRMAAGAMERVRVELALKQSEERYRQTIAMISDVIWRYEVDETGAFAESFVSPVADRLLGLPEGTIGDSFEKYFEYVLPEDLPEVRKKFAEGLRHSGRHLVQEYRLRKGDGSILWVRSNGKAHLLSNGHVAGYGSTTDVTDRKRIEEALRLRSLVLDQIQDHVTVTDLNGRITFVNRAELTTFHRSESEIIGSSVAIYGEDPTRGAAQREIVEKTLRDGTWRGEVINYTREGDEHIMDCRTQTVFDETGVPVALCGIATDITQRVHAEQTQKKLQDQLQQAMRVEAIGRLAGGIAHDFNNMLGVIIANTELALEHLDSENPLQSDLTEVLKAARHSANLTGQLLTFARRQAIAPQLLDVNETLTGMLKMLRRIIGEDIELIWKPAVGACVVRMDPSQVEQTLTNLSVNARDAISGVGTITIGTRCVKADEPFCQVHPEARPGDFVELTVSDTGCGMASSMIPHLFEPFFTTKELGSGTGLGLATVDGIVRQNEGFITVESRLQEGTTFRIYFPRHLGSPQAQQDLPKPAPVSRPGRETILLVEDEGALLRVSRRILERQGYTVLASENPVAALALASAHPGKIDLLVTDIIMPEMNGRELAAAFLKQFSDARCVFMSGYTADVIASHGVLHEDTLFLQKPFTPDQLATIVRVALDRAP